ncbi:MAG: 4-(cytidine 5'-diphospho)-2-C-methyl-D-erythritol kinase [Alphaproteobacteria bacterium]|nr:4-(cytidine 5'-diphospho)-2-C-methyl-D-erythritol kinase [Alphaproteobacteria bacterium]
MSAAQTESATVLAPAKINLYFHITGRRADGYHLVDSLVGFTTLGDTLSIRAGEPLDIVSEGPFADRMPPPYKNLVYQAAQLLADTAGVQARAHITITKNLPVAAGIGGGSTDAAAAMKALMTLWGIAEDSVDLQALGLLLGSDVPACLRAHTTYAGGIGEVLDEAPQLPKAGILLVNPGVALVTSSVFQARKGGFNPPDRLTKAPKGAEAFSAMLAERGNDLTDAAIRLCPVIRNVLSALEAAPGCHLAQMTGSGATCFGVFDDLAAAQEAAAAVEQDGWWVAPTELNTETV